MKKDPARYGNPVLAGSDPSILKPVKGEFGTFEIVPDDVLEVHVLFFVFDDGSRTSLACHANGYSVRQLAADIIKAWKTKSLKDAKRAFEQFDYIADCGGMTRKKSCLDHILALCHKGETSCTPE